MKQILFLILTFCIFSTFSFAQKSTEHSRNSEISTNKTPANISVQILYKPRANYPKPDEGTVCVQGVVRLRVEFLDSEEIGRIAVVSGLPYGATENAIEAARKIKFNPARKEGKPTTVFRVVEFSFSIY